MLGFWRVRGRERKREQVTGIHSSLPMTTFAADGDIDKMPRPPNSGCCRLSSQSNKAQGARRAALATERAQRPPNDAERYDARCGAQQSNSRAGPSAANMSTSSASSPLYRDIYTET